MGSQYYHPESKNSHPYGSRRHHCIDSEGSFSGFSLRYHVELIAREFTSLSVYFLQGKSFIWVLKLIRLIAFTIALLPAFIVFAWYYYISSDRAVFCYADESRKTSRHYIDIYGATSKPRPFKSFSKQQISRNFESSSERTRILRSASSFFSDDDINDNQRNLSSQDGTGKPVVIFLTGGAWTIGYKMWGALLARALVPMGIMVAIPDYRNFPQAMIDGMINDIDIAIQYVIDNCDFLGGNSKKIVIVGQSAGAHLGSTIIINKVLESFHSLDYQHETSWRPTDIKGFMAVSGPYNMVRMKEVFHKHGLPRNIVSALFCNNVEKYSPVHLARKLKKAPTQQLTTLFPPIAILHGSLDKTVPILEATTFSTELEGLGITSELCVYQGWSHTDAILEAPMEGNHKFHLDLFNAIIKWTQNSGDEPPFPIFDLSHPSCKRICPHFLIRIGRWINPF